MMRHNEETIYQMHAEVCKTLAHACRIEIIDRLREGETKAGELARIMEISKANLSQHLSVLRRHGIVETRREGAHIYYRISNPKVVRACQLMREVLMERLAIGSKLATIAHEMENG